MLLFARCCTERIKPIRRKFIMKQIFIVSITMLFVFGCASAPKQTENIYILDRLKQIEKQEDISVPRQVKKLLTQENNDVVYFLGESKRTSRVISTAQKEAQTDALRQFSQWKRSSVIIENDNTNNITIERFQSDISGTRLVYQIEFAYDKGFRSIALMAFPINDEQ